MSGLFLYSWQRPTLPQGLPSSTIGAGGLNFSVRNGKRCFPSAIATRKNLFEYGLSAKTKHRSDLLKSVKKVKPHG